MRLTLYFLPLSILLFGCNKEKSITVVEPIIYPVKLAADIYQPLAQPQLFTRNGQITNAAVVEKYTKMANALLFHTNLKSTSPWKDTVNYISKDTVVFASPRLLDIRIVKKVGDYNYLYMKDTTVGFGQVSKRGELKEIIENIGIHKNYYSNKACPRWEVDCGYIKIFEAAVTTGDANQLSFPYLSFRLTRKTAYIDQRYQGRVNNVFDKASLAFLQRSDTLLIQAHQVVYKKVK